MCPFPVQVAHWPPEEWATCFVLSVRREKGFSREGEKEESLKHTLHATPPALFF